MSRRLLAACLIPCWLGCAPGPAAFGDAERAAVTDTVRALVDSLWAANDRRDAAALVEYFAPGDQFALFDNGHMYSPAQYKETWGGIFATIRSVSSKRSQLRILPLSPAAASVMATLTFTVTTNAGVSFDGEGTWTAVVQRRPEGWRFVHSHESELHPK